MRVKISDRRYWTVLLAAGGTLTAFDGSPFRYAKPEFRNGHFIARGG